MSVIQFLTLSEDAGIPLFLTTSPLSPTRFLAESNPLKSSFFFSSITVIYNQSEFAGYSLKEEVIRIFSLFLLRGHTIGQYFG